MVLDAAVGTLTTSRSPRCSPCPWTPGVGPRAGTRPSSSSHGSAGHAPQGPDGSWSPAAPFPSRCRGQEERGHEATPVSENTAGHQACCPAPRPHEPRPRTGLAAQMQRKEVFGLVGRVLAAILGFCLLRKKWRISTGKQSIFSAVKHALHDTAGQQ